MLLHLTEILKGGCLQFLLLVPTFHLASAQDLPGVGQGLNMTYHYSPTSSSSSSSSSSESSISLSSSLFSTLSLQQRPTHYTIYTSYSQPSQSTVTITTTAENSEAEDPNLFVDEGHPEGGRLSTFTSDGTVYVMDIYPGYTETISHTTESSEDVYSSTGEKTEVVTSESISYHFDFTFSVTSSSSYVRPTTREERRTRDHVETRTRHHAYSYPPVAWSLLHEKWKSEEWWASVISVSEEHLRTMLGQVSTDPMLYLTTIYEWKSFRIVSDGYYVEYWEHVPILITLTAQAFTERVTWVHDMPYTVTGYYDTDYTSWEVITIGGRTVTEYVVDGVTHTELPGGLAPKTEAATRDRETEERRAEDSVTTERATEHPSSEERHTTSILTSREIPPSRPETIVSSTTTVGPFSHTTTVYTETTFTVDTDGRRSPKVIYHVKTPAVPTMVSSVFIPGPYSILSTVYTETTYLAGTNGVTSPEIIYQILAPGLEPAFVPQHREVFTSHSDASSSEGVVSETRESTESTSEDHPNRGVTTSDSMEISSSSMLPTTLSPSHEPLSSTSSHSVSDESPQSHSVQTESPQVHSESMTSAQTESPQVHSNSTSSHSMSDESPQSHSVQTESPQAHSESTTLSQPDSSTSDKSSQYSSTLPEPTPTEARIAGTAGVLSYDGTITSSSVTPTAETAGGEIDHNTESVSEEYTYSVGSDGSTTPYTIYHTRSIPQSTSTQTSSSTGDRNESYSDTRPSITSVLSPIVTGESVNGYTPYVFTHDTYTVSAYIGTALRQNPDIGHFTTMSAITSWSTTVGPYSEITTLLAEVTYIVGSDGLTTPDVVYHVRSPAASPIFSSTTTVGPYSDTTAVYTEETYTVASDGRTVAKIIEHINTPAAKTTDVEVSDAVNVDSIAGVSETSDDFGFKDEAAMGGFEGSTVYEPGTNLFTTTVATEIIQTVDENDNTFMVTVYHVQTPAQDGERGATLQVQTKVTFDEEHLLTHYTGGANDNLLQDIWKYVVYLMLSLLI